MMLGALAGLLGWNFSRHKRDKSTICSDGRGLIGPALFVALWSALTVWIIPHYLNGFDDK